MAASLTGLRLTSLLLRSTAGEVATSSVEVELAVRLVMPLLTISSHELQTNKIN